jgi:hypothetical protein
MLTITGAGKLTFGGGIDGAGAISVNSGSSLTTGHIVQSSLVIGGTAGTPAVVAIAASDASGNPLPAEAAGTDAAKSDNSSRLAAGSAAIGSIAPVASTPFVTTTTAGSSAIPAATAPATQQTPATFRLAQRPPLDLASPTFWQSCIDFNHESGLNDDRTSSRLSSLAQGVLSGAGLSVSRSPPIAIVPNGATSAMRSDLVAILFDDSRIREWMGTAPTAQSSAPDTNDSVMVGDPLEAIWDRWC